MTKQGDRDTPDGRDRPKLSIPKGGLIKTVVGTPRGVKINHFWTDADVFGSQTSSAPDDDRSDQER